MSQIEIDQNSDNFGFNLIEFARIIFRQKKIFFVVVFLLVTTGMSYSIFERKTNPVYKGSFSLLVEDPFKKNEKWVIIKFNTATLFPCKEWADKYIEKETDYTSMSLSEFKKQYPN